MEVVKDAAETIGGNSQEQVPGGKQDGDFEQLLREKREMETEYGRQMSRAKEFILSLEGELKREKQMRLKHEEENRKLREKLDCLRTEAEGVRTAAALQQAASQEETATVRRQFEEEIASLRHIMEGESKIVFALVYTPLFCLTILSFSCCFRQQKRCHGAASV
jgi:predicted nuclease with TOPRIM domain